MSKKYRLKKDVLNYSTGHIIPAGEVFSNIEGTRKYISQSLWYMSEAACLLKDWFEEITEPERIEVKGEYVIGVDAFRGDFEWKDETKSAAIFKKDDKGEWVAMYQGRPFSQKQFEKDMKKAAEYFTPAPESRDWDSEYVWPESDRNKYIEYVEEENRKNPGWLIESVRNEIGKVFHREYWKNSEAAYPNHGINGNSYGYFLTKIREPYWSINSVRRLSDNTVWTVGEEHYSKYYAGFPRKIDSFEVSGNVMFVKQKWGTSRLNDLQKLPPKPQPLFNWVVFTKEGFGFEPWVKKDWRGDLGSNWDDSVKVFIVGAEADDFIIMNKPCLSVEDIIYVYKNTSNPSDFQEYIIKLAKSKQYKQ